MPDGKMIWMTVVLLASAIPAGAATYRLADTHLYKLRGGDAPIFGYRVVAKAQKNFLSCDMKLMEAKESDLAVTSGHCGDMQAQGPAVFALTKPRHGSATMTFIDLADEPAATGSSLVVTSNALKHSDVTKSLDVEHGGAAWATTDKTGVAALRNAALGSMPNVGASTH